jgi:hypothetical protein
MNKFYLYVDMPDADSCPCGVAVTGLFNEVQMLALKVMQ